jgi:hypothetical protein
MASAHNCRQIWPMMPHTAHWWGDIHKSSQPTWLDTTESLWYFMLSISVNIQCQHFSQNHKRLYKYAHFLEKNTSLMFARVGGLSKTVPLPTFYAKCVIHWTITFWNSQLSHKNVIYPASISSWSEHNLFLLSLISSIFWRVLWWYNWATLFLGDTNMGTWPSRLGQTRTWDSKMWLWVTQDSDLRMTVLPSASSNCDRPILSSERMLHKDYDHSVELKKNCWLWVSGGLLPRRTDWQ